MRPVRRRLSWTWLGLVPFFAFSIAFLVIPTSYLVIGSFKDLSGNPTLQNYADLTTPEIASAYLTSIEISLVTAVIGGIFGFLLAYAVISGGLPGVLRSGDDDLLGRRLELRRRPACPGVHLHPRPARPHDALPASDRASTSTAPGSRSTRSSAIEIVYLYFQFPLMVLIMAPAIDGLKKEWREASENMGATTFQYWRYVALPILMPTLLGTMILLFGNAFGAQATAYPADRRPDQHRHDAHQAPAAR